MPDTTAAFSLAVDSAGYVWPSVRIRVLQHVVEGPPWWTDPRCWLFAACAVALVTFMLRARQVEEVEMWEDQ